MIAGLTLVASLTGCSAKITDGRPAVANLSASPANAARTAVRSAKGQIEGIPQHEEIQSLADRIADALAADNPPAAVAALDAERAIGYDCDFRATFNGHAGFSSGEKAEAEARKTAHREGATDFAVATRTLSAGVLGVLAMAWCPKKG